MQLPVALGIECIGATYSFSIATNAEGQVLAALRHPFRINAYEQSMEEVAQRVYDIMRTTLAQAMPGLTVEQFFNQGWVCAGISGVTTKQDRRTMRMIWDRIQFPRGKCLLTGDAEVLLPGWTGSLDGAVLVVSAGSVAYARHRGHPVRIGGWGPLMGDEGSGYYIGRKALHALTWYKDKKGSPCPELAESVRAALNHSMEDWGETWRDTTPRRIREAPGTDWIEFLVPYTRHVLQDRTWRYAVSGLVASVIAAAEAEADRPAAAFEQKRVASDILSKSADHLLNRLGEAMKRAQLQHQEFPVVLAGGVVTHNVSFCDRLRAAMTQRPEFAEVFANARPLLVSRKGIYHTGAGAALFALGRGLSRLPTQDVCVRVRDQALAMMLAKYADGPPEES